MALAGNVVVPAKIFPATLAVTVPALATALSTTTLLKLDGTKSLKVALVTVLGPRLPTTNVKVAVLPTVVVTVPTVLSATRSELGTTCRTAVAVPVLVPTEVVSEPGAIRRSDFHPAWGKSF